jgi:hypothetical protein
MENCLQFISFPGKSDTNTLEEPYGYQVCGLEQEILVLVPQSGAKTQLWSQFWEYEFFAEPRLGPSLVPFSCFITCTKEDTIETE